jgi:hypothetical protein
MLPETYMKLSDDLRALTLEIMGCTIHEERSSDYMTNSGMSKFAKQIARELKRPYIPYIRLTEYARLEIPNKKYLDVLHAPLRLVAVKREFATFDMPVRYEALKAYTTYNFRGEGLTIFHTWLQRTQADPDMRKALKLPPK